MALADKMVGNEGRSGNGTRKGGYKGVRTLRSYCVASATHLSHVDSSVAAPPRAQQSTHRATARPTRRGSRRKSDKNERPATLQTVVLLTADAVRCTSQTFFGPTPFCVRCHPLSCNFSCVTHIAVSGSPAVQLYAGKRYMSKPARCACKRRPPEPSERPKTTAQSLTHTCHDSGSR